jgi:hypothetical protein
MHRGLGERMGVLSTHFRRDSRQLVQLSLPHVQGSRVSCVMFPAHLLNRTHSPVGNE